jgi:hypothetical protein
MLDPISCRNDLSVNVYRAEYAHIMVGTLGGEWATFVQTKLCYNDNNHLNIYCYFRGYDSFTNLTEL